MEAHEDFYQHLHLLRRTRAGKRGELNEMYASSAIRSFARSLISLFVPLYLLKLGYSLPVIFAMFASHNMFHAAFTIPAAKLICRYGIKRTILVSKFFEIAYFLLLYGLTGSEFAFLFFIAFIYGIQRALYYTAYHLDLSFATDKGKRGGEVGTLKFLSSLFGTVGPTVGGFLLMFINFDGVFVVASILLIISAFPLFFTADIKPEYNFRLRHFFNKKRIKDTLAYIGYGVESGAAGTIWSIFLFLNVVGSYGVLGLIASVAHVFSMAANLIVGRFSDRRQKETLRTGSIMSAAAAGLRSLASVTFHAFAINTFSSISHKFLYIPVDAISYERASQGGVVSYIIFREMVINAARGIFYIGMIFASSLVVGFAAGAIASLLFLLL